MDPHRKIPVELPGGGRAWFSSPEEVAEYAASMARRRGTVYAGIGSSTRRVPVIIPGSSRDDDPEAEAEETEPSARRNGENRVAWTVQKVRSLLKSTSEKAAKLAKAAIELGTDVPTAELSTKLKAKHGALARPRWKLEMDAQRLHPALPVPMTFEGRPGRTMLRIDESFLKAAKEAGMR